MMGSRGFIQMGFVLVLVTALLLAACQQLNSLPQAQVATTTAVMQATGGPLVEVENQESDGSQVVVKRVVSEGPGWVAIHIVENGNVGPTIGHAPVVPGEQNNVVVPIDPDPGKATSDLVAMLHIDAGQLGKYEYPNGPDVPASVPGGTNPSVIMPGFRITFLQQGAGAPASGTPILEVEDQHIENDTVKISRVASDQDVWVAIFHGHDGKPLDLVGTTTTLLKAGEHLDVTVTITPDHARSGDMYAILYNDTDQNGKFEPRTDSNQNAPDTPVTVNGETVQKKFRHLGEEVTAASTATPGSLETPPATEQAGDAHGHTETTSTPTPASLAISPCFAPATLSEGVSPNIEVLDQEIKDNAVQIDKVVSADPGWVAIWTQPENAKSEVIGSQPVQAGDNADVSVPVETGKTTPRMSAVLHLDRGQQGIFEPDKDCIAQVGFRTVVHDFNATGTPQGAEQGQLDLRVLVDDQPLRGGDTLIIAEVVSDGPGWIGIHLSNPDGTLNHDKAIGTTHLDDGPNTNVVVRINPDRATEKLWGMLHYDREPIGDYNYNPGDDEPVLVEDGDNVVTDHDHVVDDFLVTGGEAGQPVVLKVATVKLSSGRETSVLVDGQGFSLYIPTSGDCFDAECLKVWRPLLSTGGLEPGDGVNGLVSVRPLGDGNRQVTYGGLPLYYYVGDAFNGDVKPGDTNGHLQEGGRWVLVQP